MRVAVIYDPGGPDWTPADVKSVLDPVRETGQILRELGHEVVEVPTRRDLVWFDTCRTADLVFNFCESVEGVSLEEEWVAAALELSGIPFTGCGAWTIAACHRKDATNACLQSAGLPIPAWFVSRGGAVPEDMTLPVIVKPNAEDASAGIDGQTSVCITQAELEQHIATQAVYFDELLIQ